MKQMKNTKMAMLFAFVLTLSLVWGINEEAIADPSCENARCHTVGDVCLPGHAVSFRESCLDPVWGTTACDLGLACSFLFPPIE